MTEQEVKEAMKSYRIQHGFTAEMPENEKAEEADEKTTELQRDVQRWRISKGLRKKVK